MNAPPLIMVGQMRLPADRLAVPGRNDSPGLTTLPPAVAQSRVIQRRRKERSS
jgi:hypothetical protein